MSIALSSYHFLPVFFDMDLDCQVDLIFNGKSQKLNFIFDSGCEPNFIVSNEIAENLNLVFDQFDPRVELNTASAILKINYGTIKIDIPVTGIVAVPKVSTIEKFNAIIGIPILHQLTKLKLLPGKKPPSKNFKMIPFTSLVEFPDSLYLETKKGTRFTCIIDTGSYGSSHMTILPHVYEAFKKEKMIKMEKGQVMVFGAINYEAEIGVTNKISLVSSNSIYNFKNLGTKVIKGKDKTQMGYDIMLNYNFICLLSDNHSVVPTAHQI